MSDAADRRFVLSGGVAGLSGVVAGTIGAHALPSDIDPRLEEVFLTGVRYHLLHAVVLLACAPILRPGWSAHVALAAFSAGIVLFSGSLYLRALTDLTWLGAVAPAGGLAFLTGWLALILSDR